MTASLVNHNTQAAEQKITHSPHATQFELGTISKMRVIADIEEYEPHPIIPTENRSNSFRCIRNTARNISRLFKNNH